MPFDWRKRTATFGLNTTIPWTIEVVGGIQRVEADLRAVDVREVRPRRRRPSGSSSSSGTPNGEVARSGSSAGRRRSGSNGRAACRCRLKVVGATGTRPSTGSSSAGNGGATTLEFAGLGWRRRPDRRSRSSAARSRSTSSTVRKGPSFGGRETDALAWTKPSAWRQAGPSSSSSRSGQSGLPSPAQTRASASRVQRSGSIPPGGPDPCASGRGSRPEPARGRPAAGSSATAQVHPLQGVDHARAIGHREVVVDLGRETRGQGDRNRVQRIALRRRAPAGRGGRRTRRGSGRGSGTARAPRTWS